DRARKVLMVQSAFLPGLEERALYHQDLARAVGLEVAASDERIAEQERAHVVTVDPFGRGHVHFDRVLHPEEPLDATALPNERVERGDKCAAVDSPGNARPRVQ